MNPIRVPHSPRALLVATVALMAFVSCPTWVAIQNLLHPRPVSWGSLISSGVWIALVVFVLCGTIYYNGGLGVFLVKTLGQIAPRQLLEVIDGENGKRQLRYGFAFLGMSFDYLRVDLDGINSIRWSPGQATHMSGRDCNDWSVALRSQSAHIHTTIERWDRDDPEQIEIVGLTGKKSDAEDLGRLLIEMLESSGLQFKPDFEQKCFTRV